MKGLEVKNLNDKEQLLELSNGETLSYDKLLVCSGASAFIPPVLGLREGNNVVGLRNLDDAILIKEQAKKVKKAGTDNWRGHFYQDGRAWNGFHTVLPPNAPSCQATSNGYWGAIFSANSYHSGGVNCAMADGSVRFVSETIDCGDLNATSTQCTGKSPYGVWGAMGTPSGGETVTM